VLGRAARAWPRGGPWRKTHLYGGLSATAVHGAGEATDPASLNAAARRRRTTLGETRD